jgi:hypothetical protein
MRCSGGLVRCAGCAGWRQGLETPFLDPVSNKAPGEGAVSTQSLRAAIEDHERRARKLVRTRTAAGTCSSAWGMRTNRSPVPPAMPLSTRGVCPEAGCAEAKGQRHKAFAGTPAARLTQSRSAGDAGSRTPRYARGIFLKAGCAFPCAGRYARPRRRPGLPPVSLA